jgi:hypothetical protein
MMDGSWSRHRFLRRTAAGLAVAGVARRSAVASDNGHPGFESKPPQPSPSSSGFPPWVNLEYFKSLHIWDGHNHMSGFAGSTPAERMANMLRFADRMGIERMCVFLGMTFKFHALQPILKAKGVVS